MDRRNLLKTLFISPFVFGEPLGALTLRPFASDIFIFLHGFFFMEYQNKCLIVTAPEVSDHDYEIGLPDQTRTAVPSNTTLDWTDTLTGDDQCTSRTFPKEILQFSKAATGVGDLNGSFHFRVVLPCPTALYALRQGPKEFPGIGNVWADIDSRLKGSGSQHIALVTCLKYQGSINSYWPTSASAPYRCHFYAEPDCKLGLEHTRHALHDSKRLFANSAAFDLDIKLNSNLTRVDPKVPDSEYPGTLQGFCQDDENNLAEVLNASCQEPRAINVANCGQYGILNS